MNLFWSLPLLIALVTQTHASPIHEDRHQNSTVCVYRGMMFEDKEPIRHRNPCMDCMCDAPQMKCKTIQCKPKVGCPYSLPPGSCCPVYRCPEDLNNTTGSESLSAKEDTSIFDRTTQRTTESSAPSTTTESTTTTSPTAEETTTTINEATTTAAAEETTTAATEKTITAAPEETTTAETEEATTAAIEKTTTAAIEETTTAEIEETTTAATEETTASSTEDTATEATEEKTTTATEETTTAATEETATAATEETTTAVTEVTTTAATEETATAETEGTTTAATEETATAATEETTTAVAEEITTAVTEETATAETEDTTTAVAEETTTTVAEETTTAVAEEATTAATEETTTAVTEETTTAVTEETIAEETTTAVTEETIAEEATTKHIQTEQPTTESISENLSEELATEDKEINLNVIKVEASIQNVGERITGGEKQKVASVDSYSKIDKTSIQQETETSTTADEISSTTQQPEFEGLSGKVDIIEVGESSPSTDIVTEQATESVEETTPQSMEEATKEPEISETPKAKQDEMEKQSEDSKIESTGPLLTETATQSAETETPKSDQVMNEQSYHSTEEFNVEVDDPEKDEGMKKETTESPIFDSTETANITKTNSTNSVGVFDEIADTPDEDIEITENLKPLPTDLPGSVVQEKNKPQENENLEKKSDIVKIIIEEPTKMSTKQSTESITEQSIEAIDDFTGKTELTTPPESTETIEEMTDQAIEKSAEITTAQYEHRTDSQTDELLEVKKDTTKTPEIESFTENPSTETEHTVTAEVTSEFITESPVDELLEPKEDFGTVDEIDDMIKEAANVEKEPAQDSDSLAAMPTTESITESQTNGTLGVEELIVKSEQTEKLSTETHSVFENSTSDQVEKTSYLVPENMMNASELVTENPDDSFVEDETEILEQATESKPLEPFSATAQTEVDDQSGQTDDLDDEETAKSPSLSSLGEASSSKFMHTTESPDSNDDEKNDSEFSTEEFTDLKAAVTMTSTIDDMEASGDVHEEKTPIENVEKPQDATEAVEAEKTTSNKSAEVETLKDKQVPQGIAETKFVQVEGYDTVPIQLDTSDSGEGHLNTNTKIETTDDEIRIKTYDVASVAGEERVNTLLEGVNDAKTVQINTLEEALSSAKDEVLPALKGETNREISVVEVKTVVPSSLEKETDTVQDNESANIKPLTSVEDEFPEENVKEEKPVRHVEITDGSYKSDRTPDLKNNGLAVDIQGVDASSAYEKRLPGTQDGGDALTDASNSKNTEKFNVQSIGAVGASQLSQDGGPEKTDDSNKYQGLGVGEKVAGDNKNTEKVSLGGLGDFDIISNSDGLVEFFPSDNTNLYKDINEFEVSSGDRNKDGFGSSNKEINEETFDQQDSKIHNLVVIPSENKPKVLSAQARRINPKFIIIKKHGV